MWANKCRVHAKGRDETLHAGEETPPSTRSDIWVNNWRKGRSLSVGPTQTTSQRIYARTASGPAVEP